jgi:hypothetical protein
MILHSTVNRNTEFTANKLMLGRENTQPIHLLLGLPNTSAQSREHEPWIMELAANLKSVFSEFVLLMLYRGGLLSITKYGPVHGGFNFLTKTFFSTGILDIRNKGK